MRLACPKPMVPVPEVLWSKKVHDREGILIVSQETPTSLLSLHGALQAARRTALR